MELYTFTIIIRYLKLEIYYGIKTEVAILNGISINNSIAPISFKTLAFLELKTLHL